MTRSRLAPPRSLIDSQYPHQVLIDERKVGGRNMPRVSAFLSENGVVSSHTFNVFEKDTWHRIFCFADKSQADAFMSAFGGELIDPKRKSSRHWARLSPA